MVDQKLARTDTSVMLVVLRKPPTAALEVGLNQVTFGHCSCNNLVKENFNGVNFSSRQQDSETFTHTGCPKLEPGFVFFNTPLIFIASL